jgi:hypothetical protein
MRAQIEHAGDNSTLFSGSLPTAVLQTSASPACSKLPADFRRNRPARDVLHQLRTTGRNWSLSADTPAGGGRGDGGGAEGGGGGGGDGNIPRHAFFIHYYDRLTNPVYLCAIESFLIRNVFLMCF